MIIEAILCAAAIASGEARLDWREESPFERALELRSSEFQRDTSILNAEFVQLVGEKGSKVGQVGGLGETSLEEKESTGEWYSLGSLSACYAHWFLPPTGEVPVLEGYYDPFSLQFAYGAGRFEPYRLGWLSYDDGAYLVKGKTSPVNGSLQVTEWNSWLRYANLVNDEWLFTWTGAFNSRYWQGPSGVAFPPEENQLISDFQLTYLSKSNWTAQLGFTPQINTDFRGALTSNAVMFDGRAVVFYNVNETLTVGVGAAFWNRVHNYWIPYGGVIWIPYDRWEIKAMFPKSRLSYYMGNFWGADVWSYTSIEYNVEAYQVDLENSPITERAELRDYRWMKGFYAHRGNIQWFMEGGVVFNRHVAFRGPTPDFTIGESLMWRAGIAF